MLQLQVWLREIVQLSFCSSEGLGPETENRIQDALLTAWPLSMWFMTSSTSNLGNWLGMQNLSLAESDPQAQGPGFKILGDPRAHWSGKPLSPGM